jgi:N-acetylated-alpha-linked acidic dipeptidase
MKRHVFMLMLVLITIPSCVVFGCIHEHDENQNPKTIGIIDDIMEGEEQQQEQHVNDKDTILSHHSGLSLLESIYVKQPSRESAKENLRFLTSKPHQAGTKQDEILGKWMVKQFKSLGADDAWVDPVDAFVSYPKERPRLAILAENSTNEDERIHYEAKLSEDILSNDETSDNWFRNHTFNGYSPSGKVVARIVYANFGTPEDFDVLEKFNIQIKGRIVLVRYGKCFRGLKAMNAQKRGAIGVIIYSDPHEDGFEVGKTYPNGPWRSKSSVQRGSVQFNSLCAGDPARAASNDTMKKCGYHPHELYPSIPVLPIAWEDALPLLKDLSGPYGPSEFVGSLQIAYRLGPSRKHVLLQTKNRFTTKKIWNAFAVFRGPHFGTKRDRPVILGNHRDAWVFGAVDPNSGTSCMLEVVKGFGMLKKIGWRPKRTILFASWSGEELGLLGSTAFGEQHEHGFLKRAVAYLNVDIGVSGNRFELETTATLARLIAKVLKDIPDPEIPKSSLLARWDKRFYPLGTGSDYTVFIHHLGIPSADLRFSADSGSGKATAYGVYHSIYDSFSWMEQYGDPTFVFHEKMAQVWGVCALRIADALTLPFNHVDQAKLVRSYVAQVEGMVMNPIIFKEMRYAADELLQVAMREAATKYEFETIDSHRNDRLAFSERQFLIPNGGLPLRKWFKHILQAPDLYLGYSASTMPGIVQAFVDQKDPELANQQARIVAERILAVARYLHSGRGVPASEENYEIRRNDIFLMPANVMVA